jgi:hypothetical protein
MDPSRRRAVAAVMALSGVGLSVPRLLASRIGSGSAVALTTAIPDWVSAA